VDQADVMKKFIELFGNIDIKDADSKTIHEFSNQPSYEQDWKLDSGTERTAHIDYIMFLSASNREIQSSSGSKSPNIN
jgi:hypothetical protein